MKDYWAVYTFCSSKTAATKALNVMKKYVPESTIEELSKGEYVVTLGHFDDYKSAMSVIHKACTAGYWGGIYNPEI